MADTEVVLVDIADRVAVIMLNRPEARNALNRDVRKALPAAIERCDADDDVDVMILTGADPAFCAGVDLKEFGSGQVQQGEGFAEVGERRADGRLPFRGALPPHTKPLIGAVNGVAVTGGFEVALNCDFLIASERARFSDTHARVGVMPGWGLTVLLAQRIGVGRAKDMRITGNYIDAAPAPTSRRCSSNACSGSSRSRTSARRSYVRRGKQQESTRATSARSTTSVSGSRSSTRTRCAASATSAAIPTAGCCASTPPTSQAS